MPTKININLEGFQSYNLKDKIDELNLANRQLYKAKRSVKRKVEIEATENTDRASSSGVIKGGNFRPKQDSRLSYVYKRKEQGKILHIRNDFNNGVLTTLQNLTLYADKIDIRPPPFGIRNYPGIFYQLYGSFYSYSSNSINYTYLKTPGSARQTTVPLPVSYPASILPSFGNDAAGRRSIYRTFTGGTADSIIIPAGYGRAFRLEFHSLWYLVLLINARGGSDFPSLNTSFFDPFVTGVITSFSKFNDVQTLKRVYFLDNNKVEEVLRIPPLIEQLFNILAPAPEIRDGVIDKTNLEVPFFAFYTYQATPDPIDSIDYDYRSIGFSGTQFNLLRTHTPSIFQELNRILGFTMPSAIKQFPADKKWITADEDKGFLLAIDRGLPLNSVENGRQIFYKEWSVPGQEPDIDGENGEFLDANNLTFKEPSGSRFLDWPTTPLPKFDAVWDWDEPAYCQEMCRLLGFKNI